MTKPREIELHVGHYGDGTGARGYVDEVQYARKFIKRIYDILQANKVPSTYFEDKVSKTQRDNINTLVRHHNTDKDGLIVSGHLNASAGKTDKSIGFEVLYSTQKTLAQSIVDKVCAASGLKNRGAKYRNDVGVLRQTYEPAILIEFGFVNSKADVAIMDAKFEDICFTIAQVLAAHIGYTIKKSVTHTSKKPVVSACDKKIGRIKLDGENTWRMQSQPLTDDKAVQKLQDALNDGVWSYVEPKTFDDGTRMQSGAYRERDGWTYEKVRAVAEKAIDAGANFVTIVGYKE